MYYFNNKSVRKLPITDKRDQWQRPTTSTPSSGEMQYGWHEEDGTHTLLLGTEDAALEQSPSGCGMEKAVTTRTIRDDDVDLEVVLDCS